MKKRDDNIIFHFITFNLKNFINKKNSKNNLR
jgi:hypothetical protein